MWQAIESQLGEAILNRQQAFGGDVNECFILTTATQNYFIKRHKATLLPMFKAEFLSLEKLHATHTLRVPKPLFTGFNQTHSWLVMDALELGHRGNDFALGEQLAQMHLKPHCYYGWEHDNFIGSTVQKNTWNDDWVEFFITQRLMPQIELSQSKALKKEAEAFYTKLSELLPSQPHASILHGDLWSGNAAFLSDGTPVIFDPASYIGDRETDLAMTRLFGGFNAEFYAGYQSVFPMDAGFENRIQIYNLYHILNHYTLFGGHYHDQALSIMQSYA